MFYKIQHIQTDTSFSDITINTIQRVQWKILYEKLQGKAGMHFFHITGFN